MTPESVSQLIAQALMVAFWIAAPLLAIAFASGLLINIIQIVTSLQDSAFSTIPRLAVFLVGTLLLMPWMLRRLISYTLVLLGDLSHYAR
jgi:flagellar biosynthesis protein FliQ